MLVAMGSPVLPNSIDCDSSSDDENGKRPRTRGTSVTFSEKVHVYEFQRDHDAHAPDSRDGCQARLAQVFEEGKRACQTLDAQMSRELREAEHRAREHGGPFAGSLSWSAAARMRCIFRLSTVPVQLVRVEQRKIDPALPIHSVRGQVFVHNLSYHKAVRVRYSMDCWQTYREADAWYTGPVVHDYPLNGGAPMNVDAFDFDFAVNLAECGPFTQGPCHPNGATPELAAEGGNGHGGNNAGMVAVLQLAVRYTVGGQEHWDNNSGVNYSLVLRS